MGRAHRSGVPINASLTVSVAGAAVITVAALLHTDPLIQLFYYGGSLGGFGILPVLVLVSVGAIGYFHRHPDRDLHRHENWWVRLGAPTLAALTLTVVAWQAVAHFDTLLGIPPTDPLRWTLPAVFPAVALLGITWALTLRRTRPDVYTRLRQRRAEHA